MFEQAIFNMSVAYTTVGVILGVIGITALWIRHKRIRRRLANVERLRQLERTRQMQKNKWDEVLKRINPHDTLYRAPLPCERTIKLG